MDVDKSMDENVEMIDPVNEDKEDNEENNDNEFYEDISEAANFIHERLDDMVEPNAFNNTIEEYIEDDEEKGRE